MAYVAAASLLLGTTVGATVVGIYFWRATIGPPR